MKVIFILFLFLFIFFLQGCLFDSGSEKIVGDYKTIWIDMPQTRGISKGETIVPGCVSEIGHNANFIIAKQHPTKDGNIITVYTDTTNFYIIEVTSKSFQDKPVYGPLNRKAFDSLRKKLNIGDIKFDMFYPEYN
jgi:hypothetical protein